MQGHCFKCKEKKEMNDAKVNQMPNGGYMAKGTCSVCGRGMCAILKKEDAQKAKSEAGQ